MEKYYNLINGTLVAPLTEEYFENVNPADTNNIIGLFSKSCARDVELAIKAAWDAFALWKETPPPKRGDLIFKIAELLKRDQEKLAKVIVHEVGKTMSEAMGEIQSSIDVANFMAGEGRRMYGQTTFSALSKRWALTKRFPIGICGLITAWNAPMAIITWKLFPALICGNTVVLKPSEDAPLTAHLLGELLCEAGLPAGVVNIVYGLGHEVGEAIVKNTAVKLVSFTGSSRVGRLISEECGKQMKKCSLELGGKNGIIVMPDSNLDAAVKAVVMGAFSAAGQRCAATSRVFVHNKVYALFLEKLIVETKQMKVGPGNASGTKVCPIINKRQFDSIIASIQEAQKAGAKLIYGGKALREGELLKGYFIEPTIFEENNSNSKLAQKEIFGPVLAVFCIDSFQDGLEKINAIDYGLTASIFTSNVNYAMQALEEIQCGCCYVNAPTFGSEPHVPFGGLKNSGNGNREPGLQSLDVFSEWKTIYIDFNNDAS